MQVMGLAAIQQADEDKAFMELVGKVFGAALVGLGAVAVVACVAVSVAQLVMMVL